LNLILFPELEHVSCFPANVFMKEILKIITLNVLFWPLFFLVTAVGTPVLTLWVIVHVPFSSHRTRMRIFRRMIVRYGRMVLACMFPLVRIIRKMPPTELPHPCIYICNHSSSSDPFLMAFLPDEFIQVVNIWPFRIPFLGWFAKWAGYISVREMPFDQFSEAAARHLEQGVSMAAFPEGTRSGTGPMGPFHSAMFRVALNTGVPVVPVCIRGNERIPLKGSLRLNPGLIQIHMLPPVSAETYGDWSPYQFKNHIHELIQNELEKMEGRSA
jgi:1-acyl-sn-glycerol-3-phosphate acyltransferase